MKELKSRSFTLSIFFAFLVTLSITACSDTPTGEEETEEDGVEIYEPMLGKWKSVRGPSFKEFRKVTDNTGTLHNYALDNTGYCENNSTYFSQMHIKWTMVDTSLPIKSIRYDHICHIMCGEIVEDRKTSFRNGFEIRGDTLSDGTSKYYRVEE